MASPVRRLEVMEPPAEPKMARASLPARVFRILVALPLLALSAWVLLPFAVVPVSLVAVTNARISQVRSQSTGQVLRFYVDVGDNVKPGQALADVGTVSGDAKGAVEELLRKKSDTEIQQQALQVQIADTQQRLQAYQKEAGEYTARITAETELRLKQATRELEASRSALQKLEQADSPAAPAPNNDLDEVEREIARVENALAEARTHYTENNPEVRQLRSQLEALQKRRSAAAAKPPQPAPMPVGTAEREAALTQDIESKGALVERLQSQLGNLKSGYFIGPEQERPPVVGLRDEAAASLAKLREQKLILDLQQRATNAQLASLPAASGSTLTTIRSSIQGTVWSRDVPGGQTVKEGEDLIQIAETDSVQVEAYLDSRYAQRLSIGDRALIDLTSSNQRIRGRLISILAPAQRKGDAEPLAIDLKPPVEGLYRAMIQVDPQDRGAAHAGQVARVLFPGPDGSFTARLYAWISRL